MLLIKERPGSCSTHKIQPLLKESLQALVWMDVCVAPECLALEPQWGSGVWSTTWSLSTATWFEREYLLGRVPALRKQPLLLSISSNLSIYSGQLTHLQCSPNSHSLDDIQQEMSGQGWPQKFQAKGIYASQWPRDSCWSCPGIPMLPLLFAHHFILFSISFPWFSFYFSFFYFFLKCFASGYIL